MKYVLIFAFVVVLVRIDVILKLVDKVTSEIQEEPSLEILPDDLNTKREIISMKEDKSLKQSPRVVFIALMEDFQLNPTSQVRIRVIDYLKSQPTLFSEKLDPELEGTLYKFRDHLLQKNHEVTLFLIDLLNLLKGENLAMAKKLFSILIDHSMDDFIKSYSLTKDANCLIAPVLGDRIPEVEKMNVMLERKRALSTYLSQEKLDPRLKSFARKCQTVLDLHMDKMLSANGSLTP